MYVRKQISVVEKIGFQKMKCDKDRTAASEYMENFKPIREKENNEETTYLKKYYLSKWEIFIVINTFSRQR